MTPSLTQPQVPSVEGEAWQPISSAPRDGTELLLWWRGHRSASKGWYEYDEEFEDRPEGWPAPAEGFRNDGDGCIPVNQSDCVAWQPLPAPPGTVSTLGEGVSPLEILQTAVAARVVQDVCELPDRTSPDDWPEAMLVTGGELDALIREAIGDYAPKVRALLARSDASEVNVCERCAVPLPVGTVCPRIACSNEP